MYLTFAFYIPEGGWLKYIGVHSEYKFILIYFGAFVVNIIV
jgi:hypothetical protein